MFAALHIPDFSMVASLRSQPKARGLPCALLAEAKGNVSKEKLPLLAINAEARFAGLQAGWPLNRALVRCPDLAVIPRDPAAEAGLLEELILHAESVSGDYEVTARDLITIDMSGRTRSAAGLLEEMSLPDSAIWHACASTPDLAALAARHEETWGSVVAPESLRPLPLSMLSCLPANESPMPLLELWGLKTLGEFMALPRQALIERLGPVAGNWHDILHARTCRLLRLHRPPESFAQTFSFDDPVVALDPLVFAIKRLLHTLASRLGARHLAARELRVRLSLDSGDEAERHVRLPEPQTAVEGMLAPMQTLLESLKLESPVIALHLDAGTSFATAAQREWFGKQLPEPARWAETLARLEALLGSGRVGIPMPGNSHKPDSSTLHPAAGEPPPLPLVPWQPDCAVPLQRFRPPRRLSVAEIVYEVSVGKVKREDVCKEGKTLKEKLPWILPGSPECKPEPRALFGEPYSGSIERLKGPFLSSGEWWQPGVAWTRLEWDIELESRHLLRISFTRPDVWKLEGIYP